MPAERSGKFLPAFVKISLALQSTLREHVPAIYFDRSQRFADVKTAYPMLVYQASRPFRGKVRTELIYDVLNPRSLTILFRRARAGLVPLLERVDAELRSQGRTVLADKYVPRHAVQIIESVQRLSVSRRCLYLLVRAEGALLDALIELTGFGSYSASEQSKRWAAFGKRWNFQLRHLYPGADFRPLAPVLLETVSKVLASLEPARPANDSEGNDASPDSDSSESGAV